MGKPSTSKIATVIGHTLFWLLNYWLVAMASDLNWNGFSHTDGSLPVVYGYGLFLNAVLFYSQVFWLFPRMYVQNKKGPFYIISIALILSISIVETYFDYLFLDFYDITGEPLDGHFNSNTIVHILYSVAGFYYILKFEYKKSEKLRQALVEETYKTELKYLKAQLNPHFLFNGINSVYHLIGKNDVLAKDTLLQFSGLLRYQLYESGHQILLDKELEYVSQYIKIEETRRGSDIQLDYDIEFENGGLKIAPLLLIPFIENAFKHCSNHTEDFLNRIHIDIKEVGGELSLQVINTFDNSVESNTGGIGLNNVKRRLSLLYPDEHTLTITTKITTFKVNLNINLA